MPTLYMLPPSPPCRAVLMAAKAVGLELETKIVNIMAGENRTPEFLELNPQHTIPVLDDDGFVLIESRAIMSYIVDKYGSEDDPLYPKDPQQRAKVLQRLLFDQGTLYSRMAAYYFPVVFRVSQDFDDEKLEPIHEAFDFLDKFLEGQEWAAGDNLTIADIALATTVSQLEALRFDFGNYSNVVRWFENCKNTIEGYDEINGEGVAQFKKFSDPVLDARA